jgi:hypothetical protein
VPYCHHRGPCGSARRLEIYAFERRRRTRLVSAFLGSTLCHVTTHRIARFLPRRSPCTRNGAAAAAPPPPPLVASPPAPQPTAVTASLLLLCHHSPQRRRRAPPPRRGRGRSASAARPRRRRARRRGRRRVPRRTPVPGNSSPAAPSKPRSSAPNPRPYAGGVAVGGVHQGPRRRGAAGAGRWPG